MSQGRPCKNREAWPALVECIEQLPENWPAVVVSDDPAILTRVPNIGRGHYRYMDSASTVAGVVQDALVYWPYTFTDAIVVLQPSSPTKNRATYVRAAVGLLEREPAITAVTSVVPWEGTPPSKACTLNPEGYLQIPQVPEQRQLQPHHYRRDGTVYAVRRAYAQAGDLYGPRPVPLLIDPKDSVTLD